MAGYSGTPLAKKLGLRDGSRIFLQDAPRNFLGLLAPLPDRVSLVDRIAGDTDIVHIFSKEKGRLSKALATSLKKMKSDAVIWVSWPKKSSKVPTDITEDTIREIALPLGLVDIKVCAIDDIWSGLKLVVRKEKRVPKGHL
jgi:Protein of unknown function (DUF3052)